MGWLTAEVGTALGAFFVFLTAILSVIGKGRPGQALPPPQASPTSDVREALAEIGALCRSILRKMEGVESDIADVARTQARHTVTLDQAEAYLERAARRRGDPPD